MMHLLQSSNRVALSFCNRLAYFYLNFGIASNARFWPTPAYRARLKPARS
jgi:hypothetical protein